MKAANPDCYNLVLDSGDAFGKKSKSDEVYTELLLKVYGMLHYDALNLGRRELTYGLDYLKNKSRELPFPFLAANMVDRNTKKPLFEPYTVKSFGEKTTLGVNHGGVRIGIFGVASTDAGRSMSVEEKDQVEFLDPITTAESIVAELKRKCDLVIGMGNMDMQDARKLAAQVKGIHIFIISGNMQRLYTPEVLKDTGTILLKPASRGKQVGELLLTFDVKAGKIKTQTGKLVSIDNKVNKDKTIDELVNEAKRRSNEITRADRTGRVPNLNTGADGTEKMPSTSDIGLPEFRPSYVGAESCAKCHKDIYDRWSKTRHAHALATLAKTAKENDPECFRCHTTGYTDSGGYLNQKETPQLADVRCEACHGPASMHLDNSRIRLKKPSVAVCQVCHTTARSRPLDFPNDKKLVH